MPWSHFDEAVRLAQLAGDLGDELVCPDADGNGEFEALSDGFLHLRGGIAGLGLPCAMEIEVAFINRGLLDDGREVIGIREHEVREALVFVEVTRQHDEAGAELFRPCGGHGRVDAHLPCLIASGGDDAPPLPADRDGPAAQLGISRLLDGGEERVRIEVQNHGASPF